MIPGHELALAIAKACGIPTGRLIALTFTSSLDAPTTITTEHVLTSRTDNDVEVREWNLVAVRPDPREVTP